MLLTLEALSDKEPKLAIKHLGSYILPQQTVICNIQETTVSYSIAFLNIKVNTSISTWSYTLGNVWILCTT